MSLDSRYMAYRWLRRSVQGARILFAKAGDEDDASWQEFLRQRYGGGQARVPNPHPDPFYRHQNPEVSFATAWKYPEFQGRVHQEFEAWKGQTQEQQTQDQSRREQPTQGLTREQGVDLARNGQVVSKERMGSDDTMNETFQVRLQQGDQEADFVFKPWEGAKDRVQQKHGVSGARLGIDQEEQHLREGAAYQMDQMLFGDDGLVPPTVARADGSYQQMAQGAKTLNVEIDDLISTVPPAKLAQNPSFQKLNVLDLVMGHQDRHRKNVMYYFEGGEKTPEALRLVAIDNGLSLADPGYATEVEDYVYENPFQRYTQMDTELPSAWVDMGSPDDKTAPPDGKTSPIGDSPEEAPQIIDAIQAQIAVLSDIPKNLHEQLKQTDAGQMAAQLADAGIEPRAARAAAVRLAALQADPTVFGAFLEMTGGALGDAWKEFQVYTGTMPEKVLKMAGASDKLKEIDDALAARRPHQDVI